MQPGKTVIIGMGNALLRDDGVGIAVARELNRRLATSADIDVLELETGGIRLMEAMVGYRQAYVVDAMVTGTNAPGLVRPFALSEIITTKNTYSSHDTDFCTALEMGRLLGLTLPDAISIWGIEAADVETFGESLSPSVQSAVPRVVEEILQEIARSKETNG